MKNDVVVAKNYLNEKELSYPNCLVTMFIDYAELMAEDEHPMRMQDWLAETDCFLANAGAPSRAEKTVYRTRTP